MPTMTLNALARNSGTLVWMTSGAQIPEEYIDPTHTYHRQLFWAHDYLFFRPAGGGGGFCSARRFDFFFLMPKFINIGKTHACSYMPMSCVLGAELRGAAVHKEL